MLQSSPTSAATAAGGTTTVGWLSANSGRYGLPGNTLTINVPNIHHNLKTVKNLQARPEATRVLCVIKDNAYSTDMLQMAHYLSKSPDVDGFMVAHFPEAQLLRESGFTKHQILTIQAENENLADAIEHNIDICVDSAEKIEMLAQEAEKMKKPEEEKANSNKKGRVHLHVSTGMNRLGCRPHEVLPLARLIHKHEKENRLVFAGFKTHMATADEDVEFAKQQEAQFIQLATQICSEGMRPEVLHSQNSAWSIINCRPVEEVQAVEEGTESKNKATIKLPPRMLRLGCSMYGTVAHCIEENKLLRPALQIKSRIAHIGEVPVGETVSYSRTWTVPSSGGGTGQGPARRIATINCGYGEGIRKRPGHAVGINGKLAPIVGKVTMDFIMADVTKIPEAKAGDSVLIMGKDDQSDLEIDWLNSAEATGISIHEFIARGALRVNKMFVE